MGGEGSGRKPSEETIARRLNGERRTPIGDDIFLPNYSGLQNVKKTDPSITSSGHTIQDEGVSQTQRTNLNFSGAGVVVVDNAGADSTIVNITSGGDVTSAEFDHLSGAYYTHTADTTIHFTSGAIWSSIDTNTTNITQLESEHDAHSGAASIHFESGAIWTEIGNNETNLNTVSGAYYGHAADASDPHGATLTQTNEVVTNLSGSNMIVTADKTTSGAAYVPNILFGTTSGSHTASNYTQGTVMFIYS